MAVKPVYIDRALMLGPYVGLCMTETAYNAEVKRLRVKNPPAEHVSAGANATTHFFENQHGETVALVCMPYDSRHTQVQHHALLVHEAVHVWRAHCENIGERSPSEEFEAYGIQAIAQGLMAAYDKQRGTQRQRRRT